MSSASPFDLFVNLQGFVRVLGFCSSFRTKHHQEATLCFKIINGYALYFDLMALP
jgi:hypothetical protein